MIIFVDIDDTICYYPKNVDKKNYNNAVPYWERIKKLMIYIIVVILLYTGRLVVL